MIKAVFFDVYNTLGRFHPPREEIQIAAAREYGLELTPRGIAEGYAKADAFMTRQNAREHIQRLTPEARLDFFAEYERLVLEGAGADVPVGQAKEIWQKVRAVPSILKAYDDVEPVLAGLKGRGLTVGLISNIFQDLDVIADNMGIAPYVDCKIRSKDVGAAKPHAPIFEAALRAAKVMPAEAVHVGDQYEGDVVGARNAGMGAVLLDREWLHAKHDDVTRIRGLAELPAVLDAWG